MKIGGIIGNDFMLVLYSYNDISPENLLRADIDMKCR